MTDCIFCKISNGEVPSHKVWEDDNFLAFLSIFPEIEGMTIVIPKKHYDSYFFKADSELVKDIIDASRKVANLLDTKLEGVTRTALVFEGIEVPHLHAKLFPMYPGKHPIPGSETVKASDEELSRIADKIRS